VGARRRRKRTWLEASGDLGLVLPASAAQGAMGQCGENGPTHGFLGPTPTYPVTLTFHNFDYRAQPTKWS
jgi:hypothetical protein